MKWLTSIMSTTKSLLAKLFSRNPLQTNAPHTFTASRDYWEQRYADGRDSGTGSYGPFADFKAEILNEFVSTFSVRTVIEFGCGDGNQLRLANYSEYLGFDVSETAVRKCQEIFKSDVTRRFKLADDYNGETADLALSLDVIFHLVEDDIFEKYMNRLFNAGTRYVIVYSSNTDDQGDNDAPHVRHREFTRWVAVQRPQWTLFQHVPNRFPYGGDYHTGSFADFYMFRNNHAP